MTHLIIYLILGFVIGLFEQYRTVREMGDMPFYERANLTLRVTLAWPTYLIEEFMYWLGDDEED
jgi:hypothetical protein